MTNRGCFWLCTSSIEGDAMYMQNNILASMHVCGNKLLTYVLLAKRCRYLLQQPLESCRCPCPSSQGHAMLPIKFQPN